MKEKETFRQLFPKYPLTSAQGEIVDCATCVKREVKKNKQGDLAVELQMTFPHHIPVSALYEIENECQAFYSLYAFRIIPQYAPELFQINYIDEIAEEATRSGAVTRGFFSDASYNDDGKTIRVSLPFNKDGVDLVIRSNAEALLSSILENWYGLKRNFEIIVSERAKEQMAVYQAEIDKLIQEYERQAIEADRSQMASVPQRKKEEVETPELPRTHLSALFPDKIDWKQIDEQTWHMAHMDFSTEGAEAIYGLPFDLSTPLPIGGLDGPVSRAVLFGEVFEVTTKESRNKDKLTVTIGISDGVFAIYVKQSGAPDEVEALNKIKIGMSLAVSCRVYRDNFDNDLTASPKAIMRIKRVMRQDDATEKRTELHLHTTMSQMDAYIEPADLISTAVRWGWKSIAITDHGSVQAFPVVMNEVESQKADLKVLWGMEAYFVNDKTRALYGTNTPAFDDEMIVFDIETTGLNVLTCAITEIAAVKIRNGEIVEEFDTFVKIDQPVPPEITALTTITDDMLKDAPSLREALEQFFAFIGNRILIAHNATFDCGFIRVAAQACGLAFENTYLDTLALSRYLNPELKKHALDIVAKHYGLGDFQHHRANEDSQMLARIFFCMQQRLRDEGIQDFARLSEAMSEKSDPIKLRPYHMIIFARNLKGLKNLYRLISESYLQYYNRHPRIPRSLLEQYREGLIIGSACEAGELYQALLEKNADADIEEIASFYDYLEIQPLCNNRFMIDSGKVPNEDTLRDINRRIVELGDKLGKPVVATCDAHFLNREDELSRKIVLKGMKFSDGDRNTGLYLRTTEEMLEEFSYLGPEIAHRVVIDAPNQIAAQCEKIRPIPEGRYEPKMEGAEQELTDSCWNRAREWYGFDDGSGVKIPQVVSDRLSRELKAIIEHGFSVLYMIAVRLVAYSEAQGYLVGSRGSVGSSFVAAMSGISEVNPLPPHYRCPHCRYSQFFTDGSVGSGFDLPDAICPHCGTSMLTDGHDIPFETFLGFEGEKSPDIDLNFSGDVQGVVHKYTEELFGEGNVFRAGTISTLATKTAYGYVVKYLKEKGISLPRAEVNWLVERTAGVKRTTGQHPGGIIVIPKDKDIYDFTPIQHPADDPHSSIITTHFQFSHLHETILKLDELGHDIPTKYKMLERYTNTSVLDVKMNDPKVYQLFRSTSPLGITPEDIGGCKLGTYGLPEMGTHFIQSVLLDAQPKNFADLLQISGLTHGQNVWLGNAQDLIRDGICDISKVIGTRDGIMLDLIRYGLPDSDAFTIMESVRKGKGLKPEWEGLMREHGVPDWYIDSCKKIKYMFPKAHAAAYVMSAIRLGWYKIYYPLEFYAAFLSVAPGGFDAEIVMGGKQRVHVTIEDTAKKPPDVTTQKDKELISTLQLVEESMARGIQYLPPSLQKSDYRYFLPEDGKIRMPFTALGGLGETAAKRIVEVRNEGELVSIEDLRIKAGLSKSVIEVLRKAHALDGMTETNQFSFF